MWAKTFENANRRLAAWGLVFTAFPEMVIIHRPGRMHSNVDPLSRLPRIPTFISPSRHDLPEPSLSMEYEDLQRAWQSFIEDRELSLEVKTATTHTANESATETNPEPLTQLTATAWNEAYIMLVSCIDYALDMTCIQSVSQCFIVCGIL